MAGDSDQAGGKEDRALFRASVKGVRRLRRQPTAPQRRRIPPVPRQTMADEARVREELLTHDFDPVEIEVGDELLFARPGLQHGVMRKLRRGQFVVAAELDLHGMTVPIARRALNEFLAHCLATDARCVRIIHGKGLGTPNRQPVLKARLNTWLRQCGDILAFCSTPAHDGGTGAVYALLKKRR
jgi:DNA-nicking Smr family endonuclease